MIKLIGTIAIMSMLSACNQPGQTIIFEKIIFHSSSCFGTCPTYYLQLEKDKSFRLYAERVFKKNTNISDSDFDSTRMGYFTGHIEDTSFNKLLTELKIIGLDTINFDAPIFYTDGPEICLIVYYNGKRRILESSCPTPKAGKLISTLYEICETSIIKRSDKIFEIENCH
jgi:hypothetical protein